MSWLCVPQMRFGCTAHVALGKRCQERRRAPLSAPSPCHVFFFFFLVMQIGFGPCSITYLTWAMPVASSAAASFCLISVPSGSAQLLHEAALGGL